MFAIGRDPCTKGIGLEDVGVKLHPKYVYIIDQASSVKMAGYWPSSLFAFLWTETKSRSIKT